MCSESLSCLTSIYPLLLSARWISRDLERDVIKRRNVKEYKSNKFDNMSAPIIKEKREKIGTRE